MEHEIALLKLKLANARDALYFAKVDRDREVAELRAQWEKDQAHITECHKTITELLGATS